MYRSVLALLFASVLLLGGCAAGKQTVPKEKSGQETNMDGLAFDRSDEEITYMDNPKLKALLACELDAWVENDPYLSPREKQVLRNQQPSQEEKTIIR